MSRRRTSILRRLWELIFRKNKSPEDDEESPRENLLTALATLENKVSEAESEFADFLMSFRQSEAQYQEVLEDKEEWSHQVQSLSAMYRQAGERNETEQRMNQLHEGLKHALREELQAEKKAEKQKELLDRQQTVKSGLSRNITKFKDHKNKLENRINELTVRENLAITEKELYASSHGNGYSWDLEDFEKQVREHESIAIGLKELNSPPQSELWQHCGRHGTGTQNGERTRKLNKILQAKCCVA